MPPKSITNPKKAPAPSNGHKGAPPAAAAASSISDIFGALGKRGRDENRASASTVEPQANKGARSGALVSSTPSSCVVSSARIVPSRQPPSATSSSQRVSAPLRQAHIDGDGSDDEEDNEEEDEEEEVEEEELTAEQEIAAFKKKIEQGKEGDGLYRPSADEFADQNGLFRDLDDDTFFSKRSATTGTVKRLEDGTRVVTEDTFNKVLLRQTAASKKNVPGSTPHCPFDCDCCF